MNAEPRRSLKRAGTIALRAALIAGIAITLFVAYGLVNNAWYHVLAVQGGSMEPEISAGDLIVITRPPERIEVGQVLTLQVDGSLVTHRVVEVRPDGTFVTQGDANDTRDDFTANEVHIVGEYRFSLPLVGRLVEPVVSGAWFSDGGQSGASAGSGTWPMLSALRVDGAAGRIIWNALPKAIPYGSPLVETSPSEEPTPSEEPSDEASPIKGASPSAVASPSEGASPDEEVVPVDGASTEPSPSQDAPPSEQPSPSQDSPPSEEASPSQEPSPSQEATPSEEAAPSEEAPPNEET